MAMGSKLTGKPALLTEFAIYNLNRNNVFSCTKAQKELGFSYRPFLETIQDEVAWLHAKGKINCPNTPLIKNLT